MVKSQLEFDLDWDFYFGCDLKLCFGYKIACRHLRLGRAHSYPRALSRERRMPFPREKKREREKIRVLLVRKHEFFLCVI